MLTIDILGHEISQGIISVIISVIVLLFILNKGYKLMKNKENHKIESNFEMIFIMIIEFITSIPKAFLGEKRGKKFAPLGITLFTIIFMSNTLVIFGLREGATAIIFPLTLAFTMFFIWTIYALKTVGIKRYVKDIFFPIPLMFPMEIIGRLAMPVSMGMRLFGNVFSGFLVMGLLWMAIGSLITSGIIGAIFGFIFGPMIGAALTFYFSIFAPFIQALVFTSLTMSNINSLVEEE